MIILTRLERAMALVLNWLENRRDQASRRIYHETRGDPWVQCGTYRTRRGTIVTVTSDLSVDGWYQVDEWGRVDDVRVTSLDLVEKLT